MMARVPRLVVKTDVNVETASVPRGHCARLMELRIVKVVTSGIDAVSLSI
jgi:hypothetical protein